MRPAVMRKIDTNSKNAFFKKLLKFHKGKKTPGILWGKKGSERLSGKLLWKHEKLGRVEWKNTFFCEFKISLLSLALLRASWGQKRHGKSEWKILKMSKEDQKFSGLCIQQFDEWWNDATATFSLLNAIQCWFWNELKRGKERYAAVAIVYWRERSVLSISEKAFKTTKAAHQSTHFSNFQTCASPTSLLVCLFVLAWKFSKSRSIFTIDVCFPNLA